jgi:hypothetical protein
MLRVAGRFCKMLRVENSPSACVYWVVTGLLPAKTNVTGPDIKKTQCLQACCGCCGSSRGECGDVVGFPLLIMIIILIRPILCRSLCRGPEFRDPNPELRRKPESRGSPPARAAIQGYASQKKQGGEDTNAGGRSAKCRVPETDPAGEHLGATNTA